VRTPGASLPGAGRHGGRPAPERRLAGLDGLRAVAVVAVVVFHVRADTLPGGYLGVDVFFVVSGFLITTLLLREIARTGRIGLRAFWLRRARRLLPALGLVVVVCVSAARLVGGDLLVDLDRQVLGALTFSTNWVEIGAGSSYFTHTAPLLFATFWSLAVEEQFYLVWPVALAVLLAVVPPGLRVRAVLGLAALSAVLMAVLVVPGQDPTRVYYGTDTHAFGLMIGAALALARERAPAGTGGPRHGTGLVRGREIWPSASSAARTAVGVLGLAGLVLLTLTLRDTATVAYRGGILLASVCTAVVIAAVVGPPTALGRVLDAAPLAWVGQRSYGLYLWHWPVLLLLTAARPPTVPDSSGWWTTRALAVALTVLLAAASYRWVEMPVRRDGFRVVVGRVVAACRAPAGVVVWARTGVAVAASLLVVTAGVALTAPHQSETERTILAGEAQLQAGPAQAGPARPDPGADPTTAPVSADEDDDAAAGSPPAPEPTEPPPALPAAPPGAVPTGEEITAFGDSMLVTSLHGLTARFPGIDVRAQSVLQWPDGAEVVRAALAEGSVRRAVVLAYGTNAGVRDPALVRDLVEELGPDRMIVLVSVYQYSYWVPETNARLAQIADEHDNVVLADWAGTISTRPELLQSDQIHPGVEGGHLYAEVIEDAFARLATSSG
jgi:peptidoglycan/LPS O-acetylase OafA/YrhL